VAVSQVVNVTDTFPGNVVIGQWVTTVNVSVGSLALPLPPAMCGRVTAMRATGESGRITWMLTGHLLAEPQRAMECPINAQDGDVVMTTRFTRASECVASGARSLSSTLPALAALGAALAGIALVL
jgi:hypothetical protein